jgi:hypothetical protein
MQKQLQHAVANFFNQVPSEKPTIWQHHITEKTIEKYKSVEAYKAALKQPLEPPGEIARMLLPNILGVGLAWYFDDVGKLAYL